MADNTLPAQLAEIAKQRNLGPFRSGVRSNPMPVITIFVVSLAGVAICFFGGSFQMQAPGEPWYNLIGLWAVALLAAATAIWLWRKAKARRAEYFGLFQHGVAHINNAGEPSAYRWEEIRSTTQMGVMAYVDSKAHQYDLVIDPAEGPGFTVDSTFAGIAHLQSDTVAAYTRARLPAMEALLMAGEELPPWTFGPLVMTSQGLTYEERSLPWPQVGPMRVDKGKVHLRPTGVDGDWAVLNAPTFPNLALFRELFSIMRRANS
ncbi:MAG TPA: hypothetical protein DGT23_32550 [Micromonosporaceae bacterium]|nr:hypothetical protein [Micromonosporaceae bacterium]